MGPYGNLWMATILSYWGDGVTKDKQRGHGLRRWAFALALFMLAVLLLCTFVPAVSLWLPKALGY